MEQSLLLVLLLMVSCGLSGIVSILSLLLISIFLNCLMGWARWTNVCLYLNSSASFSFLILESSFCLNFSFKVSSSLLLWSSCFLSSALVSVLSLNGFGTVAKNLDDADEAGALDGLPPSSSMEAFFFHRLMASLGSVLLVPRRFGEAPNLYPVMELGLAWWRRGVIEAWRPWAVSLIKCLGWI